MTVWFKPTRWTRIKSISPKWLNVFEIFLLDFFASFFCYFQYLTEFVTEPKFHLLKPSSSYHARAAGNMLRIIAIASKQLKANNFSRASSSQGPMTIIAYFMGRFWTVKLGFCQWQKFRTATLAKRPKSKFSSSVWSLMSVTKQEQHSVFFLHFSSFEDLNPFSRACQLLVVEFD